jgi:hypothetical protein
MPQAVKGKNAKRRNLTLCRAAGERRPDKKRDEGREKPKGVLPPRLGDRSGDKAAPDEPGLEWMDLGGFLFLRCCLFLVRFDESWSRFWLAGFLGFGLRWNE